MTLRPILDNHAKNLQALNGGSRVSTACHTDHTYYTITIIMMMIIIIIIDDDDDVHFGECSMCVG